MLELTYWYMFPIGIAVSTIAMASGIGGAVFFAPIFFLFMKLKPDVAIGAGIFIEIFGFASGFYGYAKKKLIDYKLARILLLFALPAAFAGVILGKYISPTILQIIFGLGMFYLAFTMVRKEKRLMVKHDSFHKISLGWGKWKQTYRLSQKMEPIYGTTTIGGFALGLVSTGLGEVNEYNFLKKLKMTTAVASGTSVFIVIVTALTVSLTHFIYFFKSVDTEVLIRVFNILIFAAPGVIVGAQVGVRFAQKMSPSRLKEYLFGIFFVIGLLSFLSFVG